MGLKYIIIKCGEPCIELLTPRTYLFQHRQLECKFSQTVASQPIYIARVCWILLVFEFFLLTSETLHCLLPPVKTLRLLDVFRPITMCAKTSISAGTPLLVLEKYTLIRDIFASNYLLFAEFLTFVLVLFYTAFVLVFFILVLF